MYPSQYLYNEEHEWVLVEDDSICVLGITDFAQSELGEVVYVDLPDVGSTFEAGDELGSIESVKAVAEVYTPLAGEVLEVNEALEDAPETVNDDPHGKGWLIKIKLVEGTDLSALMSSEQYQEFIDSES